MRTILSKLGIETNINITTETMTNARIQDLKEEINFLRRQVVYLSTKGGEKEQGREISMKLGRMSEQIETAIGFDPTEKEQNLLDWAFGNWRVANDKFK